MVDQLSGNQENLYKELVESTNSIILRWDTEGNILFMNQYGLDLFGFTAQELFGRNVIGTIVADVESTGRDLKTMIKDIVVHPERYRLNKNENICKDGSTVWIQWSNQPVLDGRNRCSEMLSVGIDVTTLELTRQRLQDNELQFQTLFETSHDAILIIQQNIITRCNQQAEQLFGCRRDEIIGNSLLSFSSDNQPGGDNISDMYQENIEGVRPGDRNCFEWCFKRTNGEERVGEVNLNSFSTGSMDYLQVSIQDTTEQVKLEEELRQRQKMEAIGTLAGGIAHDFNNILTAIMGFTEIALSKIEGTSSVTDDLEQVYTASMRARDLIRQILTFSRISSQARQPIQLRLVIEEAARLLRPSIPSTIEIRQQLNSESFVNGDPTQLHQVIMNLCTNAFHAMEKDGGVLTITIDDMEQERKKSRKNGRNFGQGGLLRLRIGDTGVGIRPGIINKIFDPYFTTREQGKGSGMGLAVVHGIVEGHGGSIRVDSLPGQGSTFTVYLPISAPTAGVHATKQDMKAIFEAAVGRKIMFVDDEPSLRDVASEYLINCGYDVSTFQDGMKAWEAYAAAPENWDLIITDQTMPRLTGLELIKKIRTLPSDIPILLCTGYSNDFDLEDMGSLGVTEMIRKPSPMHELLEQVQTAIGACNYPKH